jgi:polysaccharide export outer membrane protein
MGLRTALILAFWLPLMAGPALAQTAKAPPLAAAPAAAPAKSQADAEYVLGPEDVIEIEVVGQQDKIHARVYTDGTIQMNLIGTINAGGKTTRQLGAELAAALKTGGYYSNPVVNVEVSSFASRYVTVLGAVGQPGLVPMNRPYRLSEIMARTGGVQERAADYLVVRPETGPEKRYNIDTLATGGADQDPFVQPGDKIFVPLAEVFYISGQIMQPGTYPLRSDMTLRQAIARGGGLSESGTDHGVIVTRAGKKIKLDVNDKVQANDVILVRERLF